MKIKKPVSKTLSKPMYLQDSDGKLYKASLIKDEDIPLAEEEVLEDEEGEEELIEVKLTKAQYEKLMKLLAEDVADEKPAEPDETKEKLPEVVDTKDSEKKSDLIKDSNSIEETKVDVDDSVFNNEIEVDEAWSKRYAK